MVEEKSTPRTSAGLTDGCTVSNHRIGSAGTIIGEPFVNDLGKTMIWVKYPEGIKPERLDDLIELGIFIPIC